MGRARLPAAKFEELLACCDVEYSHKRSFVAGCRKMATVPRESNSSKSMPMSHNHGGGKTIGALEVKDVHVPRLASGEGKEGERGVGTKCKETCCETKRRRREEPRGFSSVSIVYSQVRSKGSPTAYTKTCSDRTTTRLHFSMQWGRNKPISSKSDA
jgi:hypothetical protein